MITVRNNSFPMNVVAALRPRLQAIDADLFVASRPLRPDDPKQSIGVFLASQSPDENTYQSGNRTGVATAAAITVYTYKIQTFIKATDEIEGLNMSAELTQRVLDMLYSDVSLRLALGALQTGTAPGPRKKFQSLRLRETTYTEDQYVGQWYYLNETTVAVDVENVT